MTADAVGEAATLVTILLFLGIIVTA